MEGLVGNKRYMLTHKIGLFSGPTASTRSYGHQGHRSSDSHRLSATYPLPLSRP